MGLEFSWGAFCLTGVYLVCIFWLSGRKVKKKVMAVSIRELLSMDAENEKAPLKNKKQKRILFLLSLLALLLGCCSFGTLLYCEISNDAGALHGSI